jgi:hypothetical protein
MISKKILAVAVATIAVAGAAAAVTVARAGAATPAAPDAPVVHHSKQDPADVRRYWTPERVRQAQENTRHDTSGLD